MNGFQRLLRSILKRGRSGDGDSVSDVEAHRVAMNGTRQECLVLTRQRHLDDKTLELLARRRFDDVRPLVVWHGSMSANLARRLLRIHDPSLRDLLLQRFPEIEASTENAADEPGERTVTYVDYVGPSVERSRPPEDNQQQDLDAGDSAAPNDIGAPDHTPLAEPGEDPDVHDAVVLTDAPSEPPNPEQTLPEPPERSAAPVHEALPAPHSVEHPPTEADATVPLEPDFEIVELEPAVTEHQVLSPGWPPAPVSDLIDDEEEGASDDWDADDLELLLDIAVTTRTGPDSPAPIPTHLRRKDVVDEDDYAEVSLHRILEYVPTGHEARELAARIADKRLGSLLVWLTRFREAGRSPDEIVVAWHVRKTWNALRPTSDGEYPMSWAAAFRLLDCMPGVPDSDTAIDILERIERRWRQHDCQKYRSLSGYVDRVLHDYARATASGGNVPIDALFQ